MASSRDVDAFVRRLERRVAREVEGRSRSTLSYSGGLSSTLLAMIARKRCALVCVVAGVEGSPDLQAARAAKAHLDYRVEYVILTRADAIRIRTQIATAHPKLPRRDIDNLVPLHAALETEDGGPMLSGFGPPRLGGEMVAVLRLHLEARRINAFGNFIVLVIAQARVIHCDHAGERRFRD